MGRRPPRLASLLLTRDYTDFATVAQLAEQRFCKPQVEGSSPPGGFRISPVQCAALRCREVQETPCFAGVTRNRVSDDCARSVQRDAGRVDFDAPRLSEISSEFLSEFSSELRGSATAHVPVALIRSTLGVGERSGREFTAVALSARTVCEYRRSVRLTSECRARSIATLGATPALARFEMNECRSEWKLRSRPAPSQSGMPARSMSNRIMSAVSSLSGMFANTRVVGSSFCREFCLPPQRRPRALRMCSGVEPQHALRYAMKRTRGAPEPFPRGDRAARRSSASPRGSHRRRCTLRCLPEGQGLPQPQPLSPRPAGARDRCGKRVSAWPMA
jgi:hypothetical protein